MAEFAWGKAGTRAEAAALLRRIADGLDSGEIDVQQDGIRLGLDVPDRLELELEAEIDTATGANELEIELKWSSRGTGTTAGTQKGAKASS
jgi:amphi-Trp domain-containing protein